MFKDLLLIILGATFSCAYFYWQDYKEKKEIKKQERLNQIKWLIKLQLKNILMPFIKSWTS